MKMVTARWRAWPVPQIYIPLFLCWLLLAACHLSPSFFYLLPLRRVMSVSIDIVPLTESVDMYGMPDTL